MFSWSDPFVPYREDKSAEMTTCVFLRRSYETEYSAETENKRVIICSQWQRREKKSQQNVVRAGHSA